ncbi:MAG TPA: 3-isopropylmalate dehydratase large subunit [Stellaceae bacterium]|nr:3-isopropylmalate dehydratase large subunit [Stellaceae bacterium]
MTLAERIIARAAGRVRVVPGEIVTCRVDLAMMHDSGGPRRVKPMLDQLGVRVWDPERVVVVSDHYVPAFDADSAEILDLTRKWVRAEGIARFYDMQGICHVVLPERGLIRPGMFAVGGDSHSPTGGAWGAVMIGIGATEMAGVLATGEIWVRVPPTLRLEWSGHLGPAVAAKDMMLHLCRTLGLDSATYKVVQYAGPAIAALPMTERMTLCNMSAELGAKTGIIAPDRMTAEALAATDAGEMMDVADWADSPGAQYEAVHRFDASVLAPQVAAPHSPTNSAPVDDHGCVAIDQAYIGACTGAKLVDLKMAARVLAGRQVAAGVRLLIAPASTRITTEAAADGTLATLTGAGAILLSSGCGACAGYGAGVLAENEVCISSTARNFKGRMGAHSAKVYLGSPYTVAASAVLGRIADPRDFVA